MSRRALVVLLGALLVTAVVCSDVAGMEDFGSPAASAGAATEIESGSPNVRTADDDYPQIALPQKFSAEEPTLENGEDWETVDDANLLSWFGSESEVPADIVEFRTCAQGGAGDIGDIEDDAAPAPRAAFDTAAPIRPASEDAAGDAQWASEFLEAASSSSDDEEEELDAEPANGAVVSDEAVDGGNPVAEEDEDAGVVNPVSEVNFLQMLSKINLGPSEAPDTYTECDNLDAQGRPMRGTFGKVFKCRDESDGTAVAVKEYLYRVGKPETIDEARGEAATEYMYGHELYMSSPGGENFCVPVKDLFMSTSDKGEKFPFLVMEWGGQNLATLMNERTIAGHVATPFAVQTFSDVPTHAELSRQFIQAIKFISDMGVIHADLKPGNIVYGSVNGGPSRIRLVDFGGNVCPNADAPCRRVAGFRPSLHGPYTGGGTKMYNPAEAMRKGGNIWGQRVDLYADPRYTHAFDMWGVGLMMMEWAVGAPNYEPGRVTYTDPAKCAKKSFVMRDWYENSDWRVTMKNFAKPSEQLRFLQQNPDSQVGQDAAFRDLLSRILRFKPESRITPAKALEHAYFTNQSQHYGICDYGRLKGLPMWFLADLDRCRRYKEEEETAAAAAAAAAKKPVRSGGRSGLGGSGGRSGGSSHVGRSGMAFPSVRGASREVRGAVRGAVREVRAAVPARLPVVIARSRRPAGLQAADCLREDAEYVKNACTKGVKIQYDCSGMGSKLEGTAKKFVTLDGGQKKKWPPQVSACTRVGVIWKQ